MLHMLGFCTFCSTKTKNNKKHTEGTTKRTFSIQFTTHHTTQHRKIIAYFTKKQHRIYVKTINQNYLNRQTRDTRHINPPLTIPLVNISIHECNPVKDIITNKHTIKVQDNKAQIYDEQGAHIITIPYSRLEWLWTQYNLALEKAHDLIPPTQSFET
jgi:hypothetical protein